MNDYGKKRRRRNQSLLIVEGDHEKSKLFWMILKCFPEINIDMENIWIYGTNIYILYNDIVKEYGAEWIQEDIDLPFLVSKKQNMDVRRYKQDFTNIVMVFDYERHDKNFSEETILKMQAYFADATDVGKLYINYPMIESYQHLKMLPDAEYAERRIPVVLRPGKEYKKLVNEETMFRKKDMFCGLLELPDKLDDFLEKDLEICDELTRKEYRDDILSISCGENIEKVVYEILRETVEYNKLQTAKYLIKDWVAKSGYVFCGQTYWECMRNILQQIIYHNVCKANRIQNDCYQIENKKYKDCFEQLDFVKILREQNAVSRNDKTGFIWVLNTCVLFVAEYNFALVNEVF